MQRAVGVSRHGPTVPLLVSVVNPEREGGSAMQRTRWSALLLLLLLIPFAAYANDELLRLQKDPGQWVMQRKNYAATGYSDLNQITVDNVKKLKVA